MASSSYQNRLLQDSAHHRLLDFVKSALIKIFVFPYATVCDLYCGGGVISDADKWDDAQIGHYIGIDLAGSGISEAHEFWESQMKNYTAEFCELDPSAENLEENLHDKGFPADIVFCWQYLQLCFESEDKVRNLLENVSAVLKPGGYFLGITVDSSTIWTKYQKNVEASHNKASGMKPNTVPNSIRTENYAITFEVEEEKFPFFAKKFQLKFASDTTPETHCLVHFPSLIRLAREAGLEYVEIQNLTELYDDNRSQFCAMLCNYGANFVDPRGKLLPRTFDILGLFSTFVFQKTDPDIAPPIMSPMLSDGNYTNDDLEWSNWRQHGNPDEEFVTQRDAIGPSKVNVEQDKGILGPGPAELRFSEPF